MPILVNLTYFSVYMQIHKQSRYCCNSTVLALLSINWALIILNKTLTIEQFRWLLLPMKTSVLYSYKHHHAFYSSVYGVGLQLNVSNQVDTKISCFPFIANIIITLYKTC